MERILWIGEPCFANALKDCGWTAARAHKPEPDAPLCWQDLEKIAGFRPDVLVVAGDEKPPNVLGVENFPCLTVFHCFGAPDHWQAAYAQGFDAALVSSHSHMANFRDSILPEENIWWSPPFAGEESIAEQSADFEWDCALLEGGKTDSRRALEFKKDISALLPQIELHECKSPASLQGAKIALHHAAGENLESAVFEAMGRGCCLVTPRVKDGLGKLFVDGEHLVAYKPEDAGDAQYRIDFLLQRPELRQHIANMGQEEIRGKHLAIHRAQALTDHLCDLYMLGAENIIENRLQNVDSRRNFLEDIYMAAGSHEANGELKSALMAAAKGEYGLYGFDSQQ